MPERQKAMPNVSVKKTKLTAIFKKDDRKFAVINGKRYQEKDSYQGNTIIKIGTNKVILRADNKNHQLILVPKIKK